MKKIIIGGFFVLFLGLSYFTMMATVFLRMGPVNVVVSEVEKILTYDEIDNINKKNQYKLYYSREYRNVWKIKTTRTLKLFGWETKIDTLDVSLYEL